MNNVFPDYTNKDVKSIQPLVVEQDARLDSVHDRGTLRGHKFLNACLTRWFEHQQIAVVPTDGLFDKNGVSITVGLKLATYAFTVILRQIG